MLLLWRLVLPDLDSVSELAWSIVYRLDSWLTTSFGLRLMATLCSTGSCCIYSKSRLLCCNNSNNIMSHFKVKTFGWGLVELAEHANCFGVENVRSLCHMNSSSDCLEVSSARLRRSRLLCSFPCKSAFMTQVAQADSMKGSTHN